MEIESRKIYFSGGSSYIITLPKKWVEEHGLKAGDSIIMLIGKDSINIVPRETEKSRKEAYIDAKDMEFKPLVRQIISYYLAGYDSLKIKVYNEDHRRAAALASDTLIGAEIIEDLGREVSIEIFLDDSRLKTKDVVERMSNTCITMVSDFHSALKNFDRYLCSTIILRESEIDRLHFLALRQLKSAVKYQDVSSLLEIDPGKALEYRTVVRGLERIADHAENMAYSLLKLGKPIPDFCNVVERIVSMLKTSNVALFRRDADLAETVLEEFDEISVIGEECYRWIIDEEVEEALHMKTILDSLMRIAGYSADIAEIAINLAVPE